MRKFVLVFVDDILIYSNDELSHRDHLAIMLAEHELHANSEKCEIGKEKMAYLGHIIFAEGVATDIEKVQAMLDRPPPKNLKELRGFHFSGPYRILQ